MFHDISQFSTSRHYSRIPPNSYLAQRVALVIFLMTCAFCVITIRFLYLGALSPNPLSPEVTIKKKPLILDKNGHILATNIPTHSLYMNAKKVINIRKTMEIITLLFPQARFSYIQEEIEKKSSFIWIQRFLTPTQKEKSLQKGLVGCGFHNDWRRVYPLQNVLAHIIGFRDIDDMGVSGIERYIDTLNNHDYNQPIELSIDMRIQDVMFDALNEGMRRFSAKSAGGIILNVHTGEIIAMCSLPDFDPNDMAKRVGDHTFNHMLQSSFEFGSIMKIFSFAQGIEEGKVSLNTELKTRKNLRIGKFTIKDHYPKSYNLSVAESFLFSSNIGTVQVFKTFGQDKQKKFFHEIGLFSNTPIEITEQSQPTSDINWSFTRGAIAAYGYGIALSPLQFLVASSSIVTGKRCKPTILKQYEPQKCSSINLKSSTVDSMRQLLYQTAETGTARKAAFAEYAVGAKTGSTLKRAGAKGYSDQKSRVFIVTFFPMTNPQYAMLLMMDEPRGTKETFYFSASGWNVAPIAQKIIKRIGPILGLQALNPQEILELKEKFRIPARDTS